MAKPLIIWLLEYVGFKRMNENAGSKHHGDSCVYCFAFYIHHKNELGVRCALVSLSVENTQTA